MRHVGSSNLFQKFKRTLVLVLLLHYLLFYKMWAKRRQSVSYTPRKLRKPSILMKARLSTVDKNPPSAIKVVVRVRPPNQRETDNRQVVKVLDDNTLLFDPEEEEGAFYVGGQKQLNRDMLKKRHKNKEFEFDQVFDESSSNDEVFQGTTNKFIEALLDGYNCSVFVYGATGAGKTFTMLGNKETPGIAYLTMMKLYHEMMETECDYDYDLKISYLEVYNETVKDLINPSSGPLNLRDDGKDGIIVTGIKTHRISCADELFTLLEQGNKNRTQHPTDANAESSRSHAVFQVHLRSTHKLTKVTKMSKLTMIDLAGSERGAATGGKGLRFSEGSNINKSLLALGNCVDALAEGHKHIPYRNSKLTRILKDSLGGNCKTIIVVNVAPSNTAYEETFNTLQYASRAKKINLKARKNVVDVNMPVSQYKKIIEDLRAKIEELEGEVKSLKNPKEVRTEVKELPSCNRLEEDLRRAREILKMSYEIEENHTREMLKYKAKICSVDWRLLQKQIIRERLHLHDYLRDSQVRVDDSMERLKKQQRSFKDKVKYLQKSIRETQRNREVAVQEIRNKGLFEDLQKDLELYDYKMKHENDLCRIGHYQELIVFQHKEFRNSEKIINMLCHRLNFFYELLYGYGKVTDRMKNEYAELVQHLVGVKGVSWDDSPDEYAALRKIMDLKCSPNCSAGDDSNNAERDPSPKSSFPECPPCPLSPILSSPEITDSSERCLHVSSIPPSLEITAGTENLIIDEVLSPLTDSFMKDSSFLNKMFEDSITTPLHSPLPLNTTFSKDESLCSVPSPNKTVSITFNASENCAVLKTNDSPQLSVKTDAPARSDDFLEATVKSQYNAGLVSPRFCLKNIPSQKQDDQRRFTPPEKDNDLKNSSCSGAPDSPLNCPMKELNNTFIVRPPKTSSEKCLNETFIPTPAKPGASGKKNIHFRGRIYSKATPSVLKGKTFVAEKPLYLRRSPKSPATAATVLPSGSRRTAGVLTEINKYTVPSASSKAGIFKPDPKGKIAPLGLSTDAGDCGSLKENVPRQGGRVISFLGKPTVKVNATNAPHTQGPVKMFAPGAWRDPKSTWLVDSRSDPALAPSNQSCGQSTRPVVRMPARPRPRVVLPSKLPGSGQRTDKSSALPR